MVEQEPEFEYMKARKLRVFTDMIGEKRQRAWALGSYFSVIPALATAAIWGTLLAFI